MEQKITKFYFSSSKQPANAYCVGNTNEEAQMEILASMVKTIMDSEYVCTTVMATLTLGIEKSGRATEAHNKGCEVYIAMHSNAGGKTAAGAVGIYHPSQDIGKTLATNIVNELDAACPIKSNRSESVVNGMLAFKGAGYGEIRSPQELGLITILVECNFHDNPVTAQYILDKKDAMARAYVNGIVKTFGLVKKVVPAPTPAPTRKTVTLTVKGTWNVRSGAGDDFRKIKTVGDGTKLIVFVDKVGAWYQLTNKIEFISDGAFVAPAPVKPVYIPFPGAKYFGYEVVKGKKKAKVNDYILMLDKRLKALGYSKYYFLGVCWPSRSWGNGTQKAVQAFQKNQGWSGSGADGIPGKITWDKLLIK